ncbi:hypothetical protein [Falsirhodobacter deserti]|uniref:hypothetical protein n=1 Tax=Falsirhodobacter deserti TaxID=1365611 RepID=UPI000FE3A70D|nr:hypothetical protein [Falsirhodobacter deserti]
MRTGAVLTEAATRMALHLGSILKDAGALTLAAGHDKFYGRNYDDHVDGGAGNDRLSCGGGNDPLRSNGALIGGVGSDMFVIDAGTTQIEDCTRDDSLDRSCSGSSCLRMVWMANATCGCRTGLTG